MNTLLVLTLLACQNPGDADAASESFSDGDLQTALTHVPQSFSARWTSLQAERATLRPLEQAHIQKMVKQTFSENNLDHATTAISSGVRFDPHLFAAQEAALLAKVASHPDAAVAANTWIALSEAHHLNVSFHEQAQREARARLDQGLVQQRYRTDAQPQTLLEFAGVHAKMLPVALARIQTDYRVEPPWKKMGVAAAHRLALVAAHPDVVSAVPKSPKLLRACEDAGPVNDQASLAQQGADLVAIGQEAGLPEALLVAEWTEGVIGALDPWSSVVWPAALTGWEIHHSGIEVGVGLTVDLFGEQVMVTLPDPAGPAWSAGLNQGDVLVSIDGNALQDWPVEERLARSQAALRGEEGVAALLVVDRESAQQTFEVPRQAVQERTVYGWQTADNNTPMLSLDAEKQIVYARISAFRPHTDETVAELLETQAPHARGIVLDLRGNGGGDVQAAANVVDLFVDDGLVGSLAGRNIQPQAPAIDEAGNPMATWNQMLPGDPWEGLPVVVLVDARTASAAELVAAALQHHADAWVFGVKTLGKGWSQGLFLDETHGFALQLTNAEWRRPDGAIVHREPGSQTWGVTPDLVWAASAAEDWQRGQQQHIAVHPKTHLDGTAMFVAPIDSELPLLAEDPLLLLAEMALWSRIVE